MAKIKNDKYYTPSKLAKTVIKKAVDIIDYDNITEFIEPSAGDGAFLKFLPKDETLAFDIEPEGEGITKADFLSVELGYKKGRCIIGNPPFGNRNNLARKFCNKSFEIADYVAFILPISQMNNTQSIYKFNLIHSENLGEVEFTDRKIHVCFNIYKRPNNGEFNDKINYKNKCKSITIKEVRNNNKDIKDYDVGICAWGSIGELCQPKEYAKSFFIKIDDEDNFDDIKQDILDANWGDIYPMTSTPNLLQWQVYKYIYEKYYKEE